MDKKSVVKKGLVSAAAVASLGLAGCVAYPAYDAGYYTPPPPPPVVVRPAVSFGYYYGGGPRYYGGPRHRYYR